VWLPLAFQLQATILGVAALLSAIGGVASTIYALRRGRSEEHQEAIERLKECRAESERLAHELHEIRMASEGQ